MTAQSIPVRPGRRQSYPVPWRPMARVTWLQHRGSLITAGVLVAACALLIVVRGLGSHAAYARLSRCLASPGGNCTDLFNSMSAQTTGLSLITIALLFLPVLAGMFIGAPLLARELESGSFRFAWTQGIGRARWLVTKMVLLGGTAAAAAAVLGFLADWYGGPFESAGLASHWQGGQFNVTVLTLPAWTLCSLAAGTFAGVLIGRVVSAMAAAAAFTGALIVLDFTRLHDWFLGIAPAVTRSSPSGTGFGALNTFVTPGGIPGPPGSWLISGWYTGRGGQPLTGSDATGLWDRFYAEGGRTPAGTFMTWLSQHHYSYWVSYEPASRYWLLQAIEVGALLASATFLLLATVRLANRRT
jgi:hypothetical protein